MSDDEPKDESTDDSEQESEQQPTDSDQPAAQSDEQPAEQNDQSTEQSQEPPAASDQAAEQSEEQPAEEEPTAEQPSNADQPIEQSQDQAADSDQPVDQPADSSESATSDSADDAVALAGGGGSPAAAGGGKLKVIAEFTEEGQKFLGDIEINVLEYDEKGVSKEIPRGTMPWQDSATKGNIITTPPIPVTTSKVAILANARLLMTADATSFYVMSGQSVFSVPSGGTPLRVKCDLEVETLDTTWSAPDEQTALKLCVQYKLRGKYYILSPGLDAKPIGTGRFRVTGKALNGKISVQ